MAGIIDDLFAGHLTTTQIYRRSMRNLSEFMGVVSREAKVPMFLEMIQDEPELHARMLLCLFWRVESLERRQSIAMFGGMF